MAGSRSTPHIVNSLSLSLSFSLPLFLTLHYPHSLLLHNSSLHTAQEVAAFRPFQFCHLMKTDFLFTMQLYVGKCLTIDSPNKKALLCSIC